MATGRLPDPNTAPLTAKGDLYTYSTVPARLAVGSNGDTLVADSSTSTGLRWQADWNTGKNKIINGDFGIWQRGTSFSNAISGTYTADRFRSNFDGTTGTYTISQQAFVAGTAPVSGYEGQFFLRYAVTSFGSGTTRAVDQYIEDVRTFAGQTVTFSVWLKADTTRTAGLQLFQNFGSGGSSEVYVTAQTITMTTSWQRFSATFSVPSIAGKTIGAGNFLGVRIATPTGVNSTTDIWGVQVEAGSVATPFTTATGTLAGELAACQRYYFRTNWDAQTGYAVFGHGAAQTTTNVRTIVPFPVNMRVRPTAIDFPTIGTFFRVLDFADNVLTAPTGVAFDSNQTSTISGYLNWTTSGATANRPYLATGNNSTGAYLGWSAEL